MKPFLHASWSFVQRKSLASKWIIMFGRVSVFFSFCIICLLITNYVCAFFLTKNNYIQDRFRIDTYKVPFPYIMFKGLSLWEDHNIGGYRGMYPPMPKPMGEYRICVLGGSTVYVGEPPVPVLLEDMFHAHGFFNVKVYNFGVISQVSSQELMTIVTTLSGLQPDLIIQYDGANDLYHSLYYDPRPGYPYDFMVYETSPLLYPEKLPIIKFLIYKSPVIRFIAERYFSQQYINLFFPIQSLRKQVGYQSEDWKNAIVNTYLDNIQKAQTISQAFGSNYVAIMQPILYDKKNLTGEETPLVMEEERLYFHEMKEKILSTVQRERYKTVHFIDLAPAIAEVNNTLFSDVMHVYQDSQGQIVNAIYDVLFKTITIPQ